jgi:transcriptional repressor NrdR
VCSHEESRVVDSRTSAESIRRRRQCAQCGARFTTHERRERRLPWIRKRDGRREPYSREKVLHGLSLAVRKRNIEPGMLDAAVDQIEAALEGPTEIPASAVGEAVMAVLREVDAVAYVRFASVYQQFESVEQFIEAIRPLREDAS